MSGHITFIIASFNDEAIAQTIDSLLTNLKPEDEVLIVDGRSTDNTVQLARTALKSHLNSKIISEPDLGIYDAWNKGIRLASGSWIAFLGCGDLLRQNYKASIESAIRRNPDANYIHHQAHFYTNTNSGPRKLRVFGGRLIKADFKKRMRVCHVGSLHHISLFHNFKFSTNYKCVSDYHFLLRNLDRLEPAYIAEVLVDMEAGGISSKIVFPYWEERKMKNDLREYNPIVLWLRFFWSVFKAALFKFREQIQLRLS